MNAPLDSSSDSATVSISVVIPCFNESESVGQLREKLSELVQTSQASAKPFDWQFIMVDDGSLDSTYNDLRSAFSAWPSVQVLQHSVNKGLIAALQTGFSACRTTWVAVIDSDCTYDPLLLIQLLDKALATQLDVVTCSPYHPQGSVGNVPAWRIWLSRCASLLYRWPMRNKLTCYTCCVRVYRTDLVKNCRIVSSGFVGVTELLWRVDQAGANIGEIPATLRPRTTGVSKMRTLRTTMQHFKLLASIVREKLLG